jgi:hypothetical protein
MRHNVEEHARSMRVSVRLQMVPLMDAAAAAAAINFFRPNAVESPLNRVVKARYVVVGEPIDPDADWQYGFYLHEGVVSEYWDNKQGKKVQYNAKPDKNMLKANNPARQGVEVAQVRAERAAARSFTRSDYALSETSVEERIAAALIGGEEYVYKALEKKQRAWTADVPDVEEVEEARQQAGGDAEDATFTDAVADDDVFAEAAATTRPAVAAAQLSWKNIPPELQGFADALAADNHEGADTPLPPASYEKLLSLVASIANWSIGEQVGDARKVDVLLSAAFGIEVGAVPATKAAKTLWAEASTSNGGDVKFKSDGDGFKLIRALASQIDALAENEL